MDTDHNKDPNAIDANTRRPTDFFHVSADSSTLVHLHLVPQISNMHKLVFPVVALVLVLAVNYSDAACCGRGVHGFCKDCSKVNGIFSRGQKCCGTGSGKGHGCNIFCCGCGSCKTGSPKITYKGGWWLKMRHSCTKGDEGEDESLKDAVITQDVFSALDKDGDKLLTPDEFMDGLQAHLNKDFSSSYSMASDLLQSDNQEEVVALMDAAQNEDHINDSQSQEIEDMARQEFEKMDANGDGLIQANEFDHDLA